MDESYHIICNIPAELYEAWKKYLWDSGQSVPQKGRRAKIKKANNAFVIKCMKAELDKHGIAYN
jgi:hypothetical protein